MPLTESPAGSGLFSGSTAIDPGAPDNPSVPYQYEVRQVLTADPAGFDASTTETVSRGDYGYLVGGVWYGAEELGSAIGFWTTQAAVEETYGVANLGVDADINDNGEGTAAVWQRALNDVDAWIDRLFRANGYPLVRPADKTASLDYPAIEPLARDLVRVRLYRARGWADTRGLGNTGGDVAGAFAKLERDAKAELQQIAQEGVDWSTADPAKDTETVGAISVIDTYSADDIAATDEYAEDLT
jgi:hypothetical protein